MHIHTKKLGPPGQEASGGGLAPPITVSDERAHCSLDGGHPTQNSEEPLQVCGAARRTSWGGGGAGGVVGVCPPPPTPGGRHPPPSGPSRSRLETVANGSTVRRAPR